MAFKTSYEMFQRVFMASEEDKELIEDFFDSALAYLEQRKAINEASLLYEWIKEGKAVHGFICRQDIVRDTADMLMGEKIPFLCVMDEYGDVGFLIRSCDKDKIGEVRDSVLSKRAKYCKIVSSEELKNNILKSGGNDKSIIFLTGLSEEQIDIMKQLCNENLDGDEIGIDVMNDGTYTLSLYGKQSMKKKNDLLSLNQIFALMMLRVNGPNAEKNKKIARNQTDFRRLFSKNFIRSNVDLRRTPAWIVGRGKHYLRINGEGFEFGVAVESDNGINLVEQYAMDTSAPDYQNLLNSYLARITDKAVTYDQKQAMAHLSGKETSLDVSRTKDDRILDKFELNLIAKADEIVMKKIETDPIMTMPGRWDEKFYHYMNEMSSLMEAAAETTIIETGKYRRNELNEIRALCDSIKFSPKEGEVDKTVPLRAYERAYAKMPDIEVSILEAKLPLVADIDKHLKEQGKDTHGGRGEGYSRGER